MSRFYLTSFAFLPILILSFFLCEKHSLTTEFVVLAVGDIFSCHAVDNPDFDSEMVSKKFQILLTDCHTFLLMVVVRFRC